MQAWAAASMRTSRQNSRELVQALWVAQEKGMAVALLAIREPLHLVARAVTWQPHLAHWACPVSMLPQRVVWRACPSFCAVQEWADHLAYRAADACVDDLCLDGV